PPHQQFLPPPPPPPPPPTHHPLFHPPPPPPPPPQKKTRGSWAFRDLTLFYQKKNIMLSVISDAGPASGGSSSLPFRFPHGSQPFMLHGNRKLPVCPLFVYIFTRLRRTVWKLRVK